MSGAPNSVSADPRQIIDDLQRQLAERVAERDEALAREAAIAEVLGVINSSPGNLALVFDAMLEKALNLCEANLGMLYRFDGEAVRPLAVHGLSGPLAELLRQPFEATPGGPPSRLLAGERIVQITDMAELAERQPDDPRARAGAEYGLRTVLFVPLRKDDTLLGMISASRKEVRLFTDKQIVLLQNFPAQAVIAMENARLLGELRQRTDEIAELNRGLEARRRSGRGTRTGRSTEAFSSPAAGRDDHREGRGAHP